MLPNRLLKRYAFRFLLAGLLFWLLIAMYNINGPDLKTNKDEEFNHKGRRVIEMEENLIKDKSEHAHESQLEINSAFENNEHKQLDVIKARTVIQNIDSDIKSKTKNRESRYKHVEEENDLKQENDRDDPGEGNLGNVNHDKQDNVENGNKEEEEKNEEVAQIAPPNNDNVRNPDGPGEMGRPLIIDTNKLTKEQKADYDKGWKDNAFNRYASDMISLHRSLPDVRDPACKNINYGNNLPDACVIIIFHNEAWSVLLRTVHSVIDRSEPELLKEVILVDDASYFDHLKDPLQEYVDKVDKVTLHRSTERIGLIRARLLGFEQCTAEVAIFLDSHCEATEGWFKPLLSRISENKTNVLVPVIDAIDDDTFILRNGDAKSTQAGGFHWGLIFTWHQVPEYERRRRNFNDYLPMRVDHISTGTYCIK